MTPERWRKIEQVYHAALEVREEQRSAYLQKACAEDSDLRGEVESLLAQTTGGGFLESTAVEMAAKMMAEEGTPISFVEQQLGSYKILSLLGAGGMGEVYQARDTKLDRKVAIKVLPSAFVHDPERLARFQREARMLAALNHANIATIHGLEQCDGVHFLVMELVLGETLAERVTKGGLPVEEALNLAGQIAEALEAAHEKGVVHRDLKPANVKITPEGRVKVLDFGLAKTFAGGEVDLSETPTLSQEGKIVGTPAYMSPEQARGKLVDKRTDIWAFGCVLYEMLTARRAFGGETLSDTIAAVLESEPDWQGLPPSIPNRVRELLRRCLQKDTQQRLRDVGDARIELEELKRYGSEPEALARAQAFRGGSADLAIVLAPGTVAKGTAQDTAGDRQLRRRIRWALWTLLAAAILIVAYRYTREGPTPPQTVRLDILPPDGTAIGGLAVSPDGHRLAFSASQNGRSQLWVRTLDTPVPQALAGTEGAAHPFWSPDGLQIGFFADGKLKKIFASGGTPLTLADAPGGLGGAWNEDGVIVFAPSFDAPLYRVASTGGSSEVVTRLDTSAGEVSHRWPSFLPGGRRVLYFALSQIPATTGPGSTGMLFVSSLDGKFRKSLISGAYGATYGAPGYILFTRGASLLAQRFQPETLELGANDAITLAKEIGLDPVLEGPAFSVSTSGGILAYRRRGTFAVGERELQWFGRDGQMLGTVGSAEPYWSARISPDGQSAAAEIEDTQTRVSNIWIYDFARSARRQLTFGQTPESGPVWSPDNRSLVMSSRNPQRHLSLYLKSATGAGEEQLLLQSQGDLIAEDWSRDGRLLLFTQVDAAVKPGASIWVLPMQGERRPYPLFRSSADDRYPRFSPNGRWVAYRSNESGHNQIYVIPSQGSGGKWQVSSTGGEWPVWRADGRELYYVSPDDEVTVVAVRGDGSTFEFDAPRPLFHASILGGYGERYGAAADGRRFLALVQKEEVAVPLTVVVNWATGLQ